MSPRMRQTKGKPGRRPVLVHNIDPLAFDEIKKKNSPPIRSMNVACPSCKAQIGESCVSINGRPATPSHIARKRMALRKKYSESEKS